MVKRKLIKLNFERFHFGKNIRKLLLNPTNNSYNVMYVRENL